MAAGARHLDPVSRIAIRVSCKSLKDKDILSKSDPCCVMFVRRGEKFEEAGRTEIVKNSVNPQFAHAFEVDYFFEENQKVMFAIYDVDNKTQKVSDDDFLGSVECTVGEIMSKNPLTLPLILKAGKKPGKSTITLSAEEISGQQDLMLLHFKAEKLDKKDLLGKSDPFLAFSRLIAPEKWQLVHQTEVIKNNQNPVWKPFEVKSSHLCGRNAEAEIKIECYDYDDNGKHDFIGECITTVRELREAVSGREIRWACINPKKKSSKKYQHSGMIVLTSCSVTKCSTFAEYIFGGLQLNFTIGIDFTASNGDITDSHSLHHLAKEHKNQYMAAIEAIGVVIQDYDTDRMFPVLGFGALVPPKMEVSHEFPVNFNASNPFCAGIQGVLDAYGGCVKQVRLHGPTNFSPIIQHVAKFASVAHQEHGAKNYFVLLILTDGAITDIQETLDAIVAYSLLPMSIIIVGIGTADFTAMDLLDANHGPLKDSRGNHAKRDIVQFVPFRNFKHMQQTELAQRVLAELPRHVVDYFQMNKIGPGVGTVRSFSNHPAK